MGADKAYDTKDFVEETRNMNATPHVAQNNKGRKSAIDGRTTRHAGYAISQQKRKRVEEIFGWMKTVGGMRKLRHRGIAVSGVDVHVCRRRLQPGADPEPGHGKCWRECMRSSVSVRAEEAQKSTYALEKATDSYTHHSVGCSPIESLT